jgi:ferredoxin
MDRRKALKIMGGSITAVAVMAGIAPLTSCALVKDRKKNKKRLVFFFTATGNSLFVAKQFSDEPLSIPQELKKTDLAYEADEIAFVCPDYAGAIPKIVREFVAKASFKASYIFSVITYGNACVNVAEYWDEYCKEHGVVNNYIQPILMVDNYLPVFDMNQQMTIDKHVDESLARILEDIGEHKDHIAPAEMGFFNIDMLKGMQDQHFSMTAERLLELKPDRCVECMTCEKVCVHKNFRLGNGGLEFSGDCEYCLACVHACPQKALTLKSANPGWPGERNPEARYRHPDIALNEIINANRQ